MLVADILRGAGQDHARKDGHVEAKVALREETVFCRKLDIAEAGKQWTAGSGVKRNGYRGGKLKIWRSAVVEIDTAFSAGVAAGNGSAIESIDFKMLIIGRLGVIRQVRWTRNCRTYRPRQRQKTKRQEYCCNPHDAILDNDQTSKLNRIARMKIWNFLRGLR
jgi:hypothetical protein